MATLDIRSATIEDYAAVAAISAEIGRLHHEANPTLLKNDPLPESNYRAALEKPDGGVALCLADGEIAGIMVYEVVERPENEYVYATRSFYIAEFGVAKAHQRQGCGERLMAHAVETANALGIDRITLRVYAFNEGARAFYERMGLAPEVISMVRQL